LAAEDLEAADWARVVGSAATGSEAVAVAVGLVAAAAAAVAKAEEDLAAAG
jgi:hypothetical protein